MRLSHLKPFLFTIFIAGLGNANPVLAQPKTENSTVRTIEVIGEAVREVTPDKAKLYVTVKEYEIERGRIVTFAGIEKGLIDAALKAGLTKDQIQLSDAGGTSNTWYRRPKYRNYNEVRSYVFEVKDAQQVSLILDGLVEKSVRSADLRDFELTTKKSVQNELRAEAVVDAMSRANAMAIACKNTVGNPLSIYNSDQLIQSLVSRDVNSITYSGGPNTVDPSPSIYVDFQKITLYSKVTVTFELLP